MPVRVRAPSATQCRGRCGAKPAPARHEVQRGLRRARREAAVRGGQGGDADAGAERSELPGKRSARIHRMHRRTRLRLRHRHHHHRVYHRVHRHRHGHRQHRHHGHRHRHCDGHQRAGPRRVARRPAHVRACSRSRAMVACTASAASAMESKSVPSMSERAKSALRVSWGSSTETVQRSPSVAERVMVGHGSVLRVVAGRVARPFRPGHARAVLITRRAARADREAVDEASTCARLEMAGDARRSACASDRSPAGSRPAQLGP